MDTNVMAYKKSTKKTKAVKKKPSTGGARPQPGFDPFAARYPNRAALDEAATAQATSQLQPQISGLAGERTDEAGAHAGRQQDLGRWYGWAGDQAKGIFDDVTAGVQGLNTAVGGMDTHANDLFAAAQRQQQGSENSFAQMLGATPADVTDNAQLPAVQATSATNLANLAGLGANAIGQAGAARNRVGIGLTEAGAAEDRRHTGVTDAITGRERDVKGQLSTLIASTRGQLEDDEFTRQMAVKQYGEAHANRMFQQYMAEKQFGLAEKNQNFQQWLAKQNLTLQQGQLAETVRSDVAGEAISQQGANTAQQNADTAAAQAAADTGKAINDAAAQKLKDKDAKTASGVQALTAFLAPQPNEFNKHGQLHQKAYDARANYDQAIRTLYGVGIGPLAARQIISTIVQNPRWRARAQREANNIKLKRRVPGATGSKPNLGLPGLTHRPTVYG